MVSFSLFFQMWLHCWTKPDVLKIKEYVLMLMSWDLMLFGSVWPLGKVVIKREVSGTSWWLMKWCCLGNCSPAPRLPGNAPTWFKGRSTRTPKIFADQGQTQLSFLSFFDEQHIHRLEIRSPNLRSCICVYIYIQLPPGFCVADPFGATPFAPPQEHVDASSVQWALLQFCVGEGTLKRQRLLFLHVNGQDKKGEGKKTGARIMDSHGKSCNIQQHPRF